MKTSRIVAILFGVFGLAFMGARAADAQVCCDFRLDFIDGHPAVSVAAAYDAPSKTVAPALGLKVMLLKFGDVRMVGLGISGVKFGQSDLGTKFVFTLTPLAVGGKHLYLSADWTPYRVGRYQDSNPALRRQPAHLWLASLNWRF